MARLASGQACQGPFSGRFEECGLCIHPLVINEAAKIRGANNNGMCQDKAQPLSPGNNSRCLSMATTFEAVAGSSWNIGEGLAGSKDTSWPTALGMNTSIRLITTYQYESLTFIPINPSPSLPFSHRPTRNFCRHPKPVQTSIAIWYIISSIQNFTIHNHRSFLLLRNLIQRACCFMRKLLCSARRRQDRWPHQHLLVGQSGPCIVLLV